MEEVILVGDIASCLINNVSYAVAEDVSMDISTTVGTQEVKENEETPTNLGKVLKMKRGKAGIESMEVRVTPAKLDNLVLISNGGLSVPVILTLADGTIYAGENMSIIGGVKMATGTNVVTLTLHGKYFGRQ